MKQRKKMTKKEKRERLLRAYILEIIAPLCRDVLDEAMLYEEAKKIRDGESTLVP